MEDYIYGTGEVDVYPNDILPVPQFIDNICENNRRVIDSLKEIEDAVKILEATDEDVADERMSKVRSLQERDIHESTLARRLAWPYMNFVIILDQSAIGDCKWLITTPSRW